jgi:type IV pilus assembly protein PilV
MKNAKSMKAASRGVTLVEILVTVVIISVGLLGVAALHTVSLRNGQYAHTRSQATALANDIIDRMRSNKTIAEDTTAAAYVIAIGSPAPSTPTTLAGRDLKDWKDALAAALPDGDGSVAHSTISGRTVVRVTVQWGEHQDKPSFSTTAAL